MEIGALHRFMLKQPRPVYRALLALSVASWLMASWLFLLDCYPSPVFWFADMCMITALWVSHVRYRFAHSSGGLTV